MVNTGDDEHALDRRRPRRAAHRHHRRHRVPGHGARRAAAPPGTGLRAGAADPAQPAARRPTASPARDLQERCLRPPARAARGGRRRILRRHGGPPRHAHRRRRGHRRARARRRGSGRAGGLRHRDPLGRHRQLRLAARPGRRGQPAGPVADRRHAPRPPGPPPPGLGVHLLRGRQPQGRSARRAGRRQPVLVRRRLARRGGRRPAHPGRRRGRVAHPRHARAVPQGRPPRAGRRRHAGAGRQDRAAPLPLGQRPARRGRPLPRRVARLARRLRVHQGAGREGAVRGPRRPPGLARAPGHHRVVARRTVARLDPGLPDGRAGHHLLRPGPAQGVPRRARGDHRRHPGRPGVRCHLRRRRRRAGPQRRRLAGATPHRAVGVGLVQPAALPATGRQRPRVVHRAPRSTTATASPSWCPSGTSPAAAACRPSSSEPGPSSRRPSRPCRRCRCEAARPSGPPRSSPSARRPSGR